MFIELLSFSTVLLSAGVPGLKLHIVGLQSGSVYTVCALQGKDGSHVILKLFISSVRFLVDIHFISRPTVIFTATDCINKYSALLKDLGLWESSGHQRQWSCCGMAGC